MCRGRNTLGKRTTFGSGKIGSSSDMGTTSYFVLLVLRTLMNRLRLLVHVVHQDVLAEGVRRREVRLALTDIGDAPDEADEIVVAREHERVDHDAALPAGGY